MRNRVFCPKCNFIAEDEDSLLKHCNDEHKVKACLYQCPDIDCGKQFKAVRGICGLVRHMENNHNFHVTFVEISIRMKDS